MLYEDNGVPGAGIIFCADLTKTLAIREGGGGMGIAHITSVSNCSHRIPL